LATNITSIRLPQRDAVIVEHFVETGEFKSKSEFIRFAVKKTINEMILKEFHEKLSEKQPITKKGLDDIQKEIKKIRKHLWEEYAKHIS
jgi:Arc/MetJ-type ribon-helix-helix transcriptional regulator